MVDDGFPDIASLATEDTPPVEHGLSRMAGQALPGNNAILQELLNLDDALFSSSFTKSNDSPDSPEGKKQREMYLRYVAMQQRLAQITQRLDDIRVERQALTGELQTVRAQIQNVQTKREELQKERTEKQERHAEIVQQQEIIQQEIETLEKESDQIKQDIETAQDECNEIEHKLNACESRISSQAQDLESDAKKAEKAEDDLSKTAKECPNGVCAIAERKMEDADNHANDVRKNLATLKIDNKEYHIDKDSTDGRYYALDPATHEKFALDSGQMQDAASQIGAGKFLKRDYTDALKEKHNTIANYAQKAAESTNPAIRERAREVMEKLPIARESWQRVREGREEYQKLLQERQELSKVLSGKQEFIADSQNKLKGITQKITEYETKHEALEQEKLSIEQRIAAIEREDLEAKTELEALRSKEQEIQNRLENLKREELELRQEQKTLLTEKMEYEEAQNDLAKIEDSINTKKTALNDMVKTSQGHSYEAQNSWSHMSSWIKENMNDVTVRDFATESQFDNLFDSINTFKPMSPSAYDTPTLAATGDNITPVPHNVNATTAHYMNIGQGIVTDVAVKPQFLAAATGANVVKSDTAPAVDAAANVAANPATETQRQISTAASMAIG